MAAVTWSCKALLGIRWQAQSIRWKQGQLTIAAVFIEKNDTVEIEAVLLDRYYEKNKCQ